jgi:exodeoxyribonuclease VII large subunit
VVTAPTGAAIRDISNIAARRNPYVQIILYPALVQGQGAAQSIVNGIAALEKMAVDVIIVGRGGGSIEDLWAFNEEIVARAIFECQIPVISAVGHETDTTIADFVADLRAPTPSAAAELAVYDVKALQAELAVKSAQLSRLAEQHFRLVKLRFEQNETKLKLLSPKNQIGMKRQYLQELETTMQSLMEQKKTKEIHRLQLLAGRLETLSPLKRLSGGFGKLETKQGLPITSTKQLEPKQQFQIKMVDGVVTAKAQDVRSYEDAKLSGMQIKE